MHEHADHEHRSECNSTWCCCGPHRGRMLVLRWLLGLLILAITFAVGVKLGEFKYWVGDAAGWRWGRPHMMMRGGPQGQWFSQGYRMKNGVTPQDSEYFDWNFINDATPPAAN